MNSIIHLYEEYSREREWPRGRHGPGQAQERASQFPPADGNVKAKEGKLVDGGQGGGSPSAEGNSKEEEEQQSTSPGFLLEHQIHPKCSRRQRNTCGSRERETLDGATKKSKQGEEESVMKQIPGVISWGGEGKNFNYGATPRSLPKHTRGT